MNYYFQLQKSVKQTETKPPETLEFKMKKPQESFSLKRL